MSTAAIYARFSSDSQREESIEDQIRECRQYAKIHNLDVVKIYHDHALTGKSEKRPDFLKMIDDSKKGVFDCIICYKTDRFFRNRYESQKYKKILRENGVRVIYAKVDIPTGPEGIILEGVLEALDEYYSANLSQNIKRGQRGNAMKRKSNGVLIFGYDRDENDNYIINEHEAVAIRKIFDMVIDNMTDVEILNWLKINGYKNTRGGYYTKSAINRILNNRRYIGEYSYADVVVPGGMPAIIDEETFLKAREAKKSRRTKRVRDNEYILSKILFCGECGASMHGRSGTSKSGKKHYYYACKEHIKHNCDKTDIRKDFLENAIVKVVQAALFNDDVLNDIIDGIMEYQSQNLNNKALESLEKNLSTVNKSINNIIKAVENGLFNENMIDRMNNLEIEKKEIEKNIKIQSMNSDFIERDFIEFMLKKMRDNNLKSPENKKRLIETFVSKAFVFNDNRIAITFNYRKNGHLATFEETLENIQNASVRQISFGGANEIKSEHIIKINYDSSNIYIYFNM